jgi:protein-L-isoaspartate(D-aspartate) O-methyltransferase
MERIADFRNVFAHVVVARAGCPENEALRQAFTTVPRHDFLGPGPWIVREDGTRTATDDPAIVYQDIGVGLAPGVPTGLPSLHAALLHAVHVRPGHHVMQIGAGTGYFTAILAELVGASGHVDAFEIDDALAARARANLAPWPWVSVDARSGVRAPAQPVDLVYVNAGVQQLPRAWIDALSPAGCVVFPLVPAGGQGAVFVIRRGAGDAHPARFLCRARFVPCIGAQDEPASARLSEALRTDGCASVGSLRIGHETPDDTAWFAGAGWWLSTASP